MRKINNWFYRFLSKFGIICGMPPIDQNKVDTFLEEWNRGREPNNPLWVEVQGTSSLMSVDTSPSGVVFKGNQGFIVKAFMNTETGEVRTFNVRRFVE